jgi:hypothetical protein
VGALDGAGVGEAGSDDNLAVMPEALVPNMTAPAAAPRKTNSHLEPNRGFTTCLLREIHPSRLPEETTSRQAQTGHLS